MCTIFLIMNAYMSVTIFFSFVKVLLRYEGEIPTKVKPNAKQYTFPHLYIE